MRQSVCGTMICLLWSLPAFAQQQMSDPDFDTSVERPAHRENGPTVVIDEAHMNFHTAAERYKPFAGLLRSDGYAVVAGTNKFEPGSLDGVAVLVIANAGMPRGGSSAFSEAECDVVRDWVRGGGALLLIADHAPFGQAAQMLAKRFDIEMGKGWVFDRPAGGDFTTQLVFTRENGLLGDHAVVRGRDATESVKHVRSFTGQSLSVPEGAVVLLKLSATAREAPDGNALNAAARAAAAAPTEPLEKTTRDHSAAVGDRAQAIALRFGKGRVVAVGEAAMFSAQVVKFSQGGQERVIKAGMNVPGTDDRQFALNVMHWLSGILDE